MRKKPTTAAIIPAATSADVEVMESGDSRWDRARKLRDEAKQAFLRSIDAQVMLGGELLALKEELGFCGAGRRKELRHDVGINFQRTWPDWCQAELGFSERTADRFIDCFKLIRERARKLGGDSPVSRLLEAPAKDLPNKDYRVASELLRTLIGEQSQKELLREFNLLRRDDVDHLGKDTSAHPKLKDKIGPRQAAILGWENDRKEMSKCLGRVVTLSKLLNSDRLLHHLPLDPDGDFCGLVQCRDWMASVFKETTDRMNLLLSRVDRFIDIKLESEKATVALYKRTGRLPAARESQTESPHQP